MHTAIDSAGWFWQQGKILSNNKPGTWSAPSFKGKVGEAVAAESPSITKTIVTYGKNKTEYGVLDLNLLADEDYRDTISWLVNGGGNGFEERQKYVKYLKVVMKYEKCSN
ncbi:hypothetical protein [Vibrio spartinae]|uniref:hypothetical protein n=1 Tax=Vibrio spartinae TaxID=1918945 RepID=UPI000943C7E1|nr:hypothetical protein [Vibrio spartinae]